MDDIPNETLQEIFLQTSDTQTSITISHVCRRWREFALGCPVLWTTINITHLKPSVLELHRTIVERSQNQLLDYSICLSEGTNVLDTDVSSSVNSKPTVFVELMNAVAAESSRWRSFFLSAPKKIMIHGHLHGGHIDIPAAPYLESLGLVAIEDLHQDSRTENIFLQGFCTDAPRLKHIRMDRVVWLPNLVSEQPTQWSFMRTLESIELNDSRFLSMVHNQAWYTGRLLSETELDGEVYRYPLRHLSLTNIRNLLQLCPYACSLERRHFENIVSLELIQSGNYGRKKW